MKLKGFQILQTILALSIFCIASLLFLQFVSVSVNRSINQFYFYQNVRNYNDSRISESKKRSRGPVAPQDELNKLAESLKIKDIQAVPVSPDFYLIRCTYCYKQSQKIYYFKYRLATGVIDIVDESDPGVLSIISKIPKNSSDK